MRAVSLGISINETGFVYKAAVAGECHLSGPGSKWIMQIFIIFYFLAILGDSYMENINIS